MKPEVPNCYYRISVKALILDETRTKFLVVKEDNGKWELTGGGLDWGETPENCLRRELKEEMGIEVTSIKSTPSYFFTGARSSDGVQFANVVYEVTVRNLDFTPSEECIAYAFVTPDEARALPNAFNSVEKLAAVFDPAHHRVPTN